jgi:hypothetical protein
MTERAVWSPEGYEQRYTRTDEAYAPLRTEFCSRFTDLMRAAMLVSFHKYGPVREAYPNRVNAIDSLRLRLEKYAATGNTEYLVDAANFAMIEWMYPARPDAFFKSTDADGSPGRVMANAAIYDSPTQYRNTDIADKDEKPL